MVKRGVVLLFLILLISGCATQTKVDYDTSKIDAKLLKEKVPPYIINQDNTWNVVVTCFNDADMGECENIIKNYATIEKKYGHGFGIRINKDNIYALTNENVVMYIEEAPPPETSEPEPVFEVKTKAKDKIEKKILDKNYSVWTTNEDGSLNLMIGFYKNVSAEDALNLLERHGEIIDDRYLYNHLDIKIDESNILKLAKENKVKWIKEMVYLYRENKHNFHYDILRLWGEDRERKVETCTMLGTELEEKETQRTGIIPEGGAGFVSGQWCNEAYVEGEIDELIDKFKGDLNES